MVARIALVALVDAEGRVLVHLHDEQAPTRPNRWSLPGAPIARGETPADAARRVAADVAHVPVAGTLEEFWSGYVPGYPIATFAYCARTTATPDDVAAVVDISPAGELPAPTRVTKEFLTADEVQGGGRPFTLASGYALARLVESPLYHRLTPAIGPYLPYLPPGVE
ncbi:MAG: hypothetical protein HOV79_06705 [Hamadaea sp.]|nr:hypothetical protein [Hamadaea sp.]